MTYTGVGRSPAARPVVPDLRKTSEKAGKRRKALKMGFQLASTHCPCNGGSGANTKPAAERTHVRLRHRMGPPRLGWSAMVSNAQFERLVMPHRNAAFNLAYWILQNRD